MMHTNGPEHHDCADCGKRIKNEPRVTTAPGIVCSACYQKRNASAHADKASDVSEPVNSNSVARW